MLRDDLVPKLRAYFQRECPDAVAVYMFGSVARGQERPTSDVDLAMVLSSGKPRTLEELDTLARRQDELSDLVGRHVDLIPMNGAPPDLQHRILVDRILVYEGDHEQRIEFEVSARNQYFDTAPYLERYRREVLKRA